MFYIHYDLVIVTKLLHWVLSGQVFYTLIVTFEGPTKNSAESFCK